MSIAKEGFFYLLQWMKGAFISWWALVGEEHQQGRGIAEKKSNFILKELVMMTFFHLWIKLNVYCADKLLTKLVVFCWCRYQ